MGEGSLGATVGACILGVLELRPFDPGRGDFRRPRALNPPAAGFAASGPFAPALLRRDLVALRVGSLLKRRDRDLGCRTEAGLLCLAECGAYVRVARGDPIAGLFRGRPSARGLDLLRGVEALLPGGRDSAPRARGGGGRRRRG